MFNNTRTGRRTIRDNKTAVVIGRVRPSIINGCDISNFKTRFLKLIRIGNVTKLQRQFAEINRTY